MNTQDQMRDVMQYMAWLMFNGFDNKEMNEAEDRMPINGEQTTAKRGVCLLVQSFDKEARV